MRTRMYLLWEYTILTPCRTISHLTSVSNNTHSFNWCRQVLSNWQSKIFPGVARGRGWGVIKWVKGFKRYKPAVIKSIHHGDLLHNSATTALRVSKSLREQSLQVHKEKQLGAVLGDGCSLDVLWRSCRLTHKNHITQCTPEISMMLPVHYNSVK